MSIVAQWIGWWTMTFAAVLAVMALASVLADWRRERARLDALIEWLAYEGELILRSERNRERAS